MHVLCNCTIEVDLPADAAPSRDLLSRVPPLRGRPATPGGSGGPTDLVTALRYLDRFERRSGGMAHRARRSPSPTSWGRLDAVGPEKLFGRRFQRGSRDGHDPLWHIMETR